MFFEEFCVPNLLSIQFTVVCRDWLSPHIYGYYLSQLYNVEIVYSSMYRSWVHRELALSNGFRTHKRNNYNTTEFKTVKKKNIFITVFASLFYFQRQKTVAGRDASVV